MKIRLITYLMMATSVFAQIENSGFPRNDSGVPVSDSSGSTNLSTKLVNDNGNSLGVDTATRALEVIDYSHHEIHAGNHYYIQGYFVLGVDTTNCVKLVTPNTAKWSHFIFKINSTGVTETHFDEDATGGLTGGVGVIPINNNRNSPSASDLVITSGVVCPTGYTTRLENNFCNGDGVRVSIGSDSTRDDELILKQNTVYAQTIISRAAANIIQFKMSWYEYTNKIN